MSERVIGVVVFYVYNKCGRNLKRIILFCYKEVKSKILFFFS